MLLPVTKRLEDVQREVRALLPPDAILVGQSLGNDLLALKVKF
jgi:RNA exonuclease 1